MHCLLKRGFFILKIFHFLPLNSQKYLFMIHFPFAKINIGLEVLRKRPDNFHDLETIFYPLNLCDILEINKSDTFHFSFTGFDMGEFIEENIVVRAYRLMQSCYNLPPVHIHLHKQIPVGAGLGGGSSDAAFTLIGLNKLFELNLDINVLMGYASILGSDCAFFLSSQPVFAEGRGDVFSKIEIELNNYSLVLIKPAISVSTSLAYNGIVPKIPGFSIKEAVKLPITYWKEKIENRFEMGIFDSYPQIKSIKERLYQDGAIFASMSGSGSSVYGLFEVIPLQLKSRFPDCFYWEEKCRF
jgi:4-diphosphocytidyl-2-C-methyl-D-erythritol kinase